MRIPVTTFLIFALFMLVANPVPAASNERVTFFGGKIRGTAMAKGTLYLAQSHGITILDVRDRAKIRVIAQYRPKDYKVGALAIRWPVLFYVGTLRVNTADILVH